MRRPAQGQNIETLGRKEAKTGFLGIWLSEASKGAWETKDEQHKWGPRSSILETMATRAGSTTKHHRKDMPGRTEEPLGLAIGTIQRGSSGSCWRGKKEPR